MAKELGAVETLMVRDEFFRKREKEILLPPIMGISNQPIPLVRV